MIIVVVTSFSPVKWSQGPASIFLLKEAKESRKRRDLSKENGIKPQKTALGMSHAFGHQYSEEYLDSFFITKMG
jgi:hypothetical protein